MQKDTGSQSKAYLLSYSTIADGMIIESYLYVTVANRNMFNDELHGLFLYGIGHVAYYCKWVAKKQSEKMEKNNTFINAVNGIWHCIKNELNFRIHLLAVVVVIGAGIYFSINGTEWLFIVGCCVMVLSLELVNTAIEHVCNLISNDFHPLIKIIKDTAAGAVLVSALGSVVVAGIIFLPKIVTLFKI